MANLQFEDFCQKVCQMLRWKAARGPVSAELTAHLEPSRYIGRCPQQVEEFLDEEVAPVLEQYADALDEKATELNV